MAKVIKDAALVIGAAVAIATAIPSGGTSLLAYTLGTAGATAAAVGALALTALAAITAKKPSLPSPNPMQWQSDPQAGLPIVAGRAYTGGKIVYRNTYQKNNEAETIITVYSIGPVKEVEGLYVDSVLTTQNGINVNINDRGHMYASTQLGAQPEPKQLGDLGPPNYTTASKLSGLCASSVTFTYDTSGGHTLTTEPQVGYVIQGVRVYDPRRDSTYPGGNGPQRWNDETTWTYVGYDNPYLFALAWLIGWHQNGKLVAGVGVSTSAILLDQFVEGANVADANGWKMGGVLDSTDDKWSRLKDILQAGGGVPMRLGAQIGCMINTPKTSLATVTVDDVIGDASVQATQAQRDRINAIVPRYMAELDNTVADPSQPADSNGNHPLITNVTWAMVAASPVVVSDYVTFDGKQRQKQVDYTFVQNLTQSQQLARYDIENSREFGPITLPLKLRWMGYKPGDVVTCNLPELGLNGQDILLLQRELSPQDMTVTMTARSETYAKHAFALGQTGTAPATPSVSGPALIPTPGNAAWEVMGGTIASDNGTAQPVIEVIGAVDSTVIDAVVFQYRTSQSESAQAGPWIDAGSQPPTIEQLNIFGLKDGGIYDVSVAYRKGSGTGTPLILGPAVCGQTAIPYQTGVVGDKPPVDADNTASAYAAASGGQTIQQVTVSIDSLTTKVQDLVATYGDTESAGAAASAAQAAETAAQTAQANAGTARDQAQAAFTAADAARQTAAASASSASTYADGAASDMNAAGASASAAHQSEVNAGLAATQAAGSASGASSSASSAAASQTAAGQSASAAQQSATNAATSAGQASTFAGNASTSASNASTSATNASGSANQASTYASQASGSASNASTSATSAATQASNAQSSANAAGASATSASTSANNAQGYATNASTSASSAQSSAASASGSAAAAQQSATLSASVTGAYLNANPAFAAYQATPGIPSGWSDYANGAIGTRVAGTAGGNAYRVVAPANADQGIYQHAIYLAAGYYIIEMNAYCEAGDWAGAGISLQSASSGAGVAAINCAVDASLDNVSGVGGTGVRQWAKFVQIPTSASFDIVALTNSSIFGARDAKTLDWYRAAIRPASDAEVAGKRADTNAATALAQISTEQSVRASADTALASQISSLTSTVGSNTSNITSLQTTVATNAASAAQAVSTLSAYATAAPNLCLDVDKWPTLAPGMSVVHDPFWGLAIEGIPQIATNSLSVIAQSPLISIGQANAYCASADLYCFGSSGTFVGLDWVGIDAGGKGTAYSPQPLVYANTDFSNSRPRIAAAAGTPAATAYGYLRLLGYIPSGGTVQTMGLRRPKFEQGGIPTAYTSEAQLVSLSSSVSVLTATTSNLAARVNTAVFQVTAQAGNSRALLRILADGYGQSSVDLVAGSINLWSQDGSTAIQALSIDSSGLVTIPNLAVGQISVQHVAYGATGTVSIWDNEPNATWNSSSSWGTFCQIEMTPSQGAPVLGQFAGRLVSSSAASVDVKLRVRRDDGTIVKGGNDGTGQVFRTNTGGTSISINWIDTVNAGRDTTWFLDVMIADGTSNGIAIEGGCGWVQEYTRSAYQHATIKTVSGTGPGAGTGGGGNVNGHGLGFACPEQGEPVLLANDALDGPGATIPAGRLRAGMWLWTQHEETFEWDAYRITFVGLVEDELWTAPDRALTSPSHLWRIGEEWVRMDAIGTPLGRRGTVVSLQVEDAHTYVVGGDLSHNKTVQN